MPRSLLRSRTSARRATSLLGAGLLLLVASQASAKKKKETPAAMPPAPTGPVAPPADSMGRVHFGPASGEGLGRVTVKSSSSEKVQVFLEGRYFGDAPITIYSVPKGDYVVEGTFPDGHQVNRPTTVAENEESSVDLAAAVVAKPTTGKKTAGQFIGEIFPWDNTATRVLLIAGAASLAVGLTFGILEIKDESDYQSAPNDQAMLDDISNRGKRDAIIANIGFVLAGSCLIAAAVVPLLTKPSEAKETTTASSIIIAPVAGHGMTGGAFSMRF